jgi:G:T/U-mismatch repair DNA glycosylase
MLAASFPGESGTKSDRATQHTPRNRFWKAIATAVRVEAQDAGAGSNGSQA